MARPVPMTPEDRVKVALTLSASSGVSPSEALDMVIRAEIAGDHLTPITIKRRIGIVALWTFAVLGVLFTALVVIALIAQAVGGPQ